MGCVYFLRIHGLEPIKIGMSAHLTPEKRVNSIAHNVPTGVHLLGFMKTDDEVSFERDLHKKYDHLWVKGEWFRLLDQMVYDEVNAWKYYTDRLQLRAHTYANYKAIGGFKNYKASQLLSVA